MPRFHVNPKTGNPGACNVTVGSCPFGEHYATKEEAREGYERNHQEELVPSTRKRYCVFMEKDMLQGQEKRDEAIKEATERIKKVGQEVLEHEEWRRLYVDSAVADADSLATSIYYDELSNKQEALDGLTARQLAPELALKVGLTPSELSTLRHLSRPHILQTYGERANSLATFWTGVQKRITSEAISSPELTQLKNFLSHPKPLPDDTLIAHKLVVKKLQEAEKNLAAVKEWTAQRPQSKNPLISDYKATIEQLCVRYDNSEKDASSACYMMHKAGVPIVDEEALEERGLTQKGGGLYPAATSSLPPQEEEVPLEESFTKRGLKELSLAEAVSYFESYREETVSYEEHYSAPAEGIAGWMGKEEERRRLSTKPSPRAEAVLNFYADLPTEAREQFDLYIEGKQRNVSPEVLKQAGVYYKQACEKAEAEEAERTKILQNATDAELLRRITLAAEPNPLALPPTNYPLP